MIPNRHILQYKVKAAFASPAKYVVSVTGCWMESACYLSIFRPPWSWQRSLGKRICPAAGGRGAWSWSPMRWHAGRCILFPSCQRTEALKGHRKKKKVVRIPISFPRNNMERITISFERIIILFERNIISFERNNISRERNSNSFHIISRE